MRNSNTKRNVIIGAGVTAVILAIVIGIALKVSKPTYKQESSDGMLNSSLVLEYGDDVADKYAVKVEGEDVAIDTPEGVDTMKTGETTYEIDTEEGTLKLKIIVEDTQNPVIEGADEIKIDINSTKEDLEKKLNSELKASDPVDGELDINYTYNNKMKLDEEGTYEVVAVAQDKNKNRTRKSIKIQVLKGGPEVDEDDKAENVEGTKDESADKKDNVDVGSNKPTPSKPAPSKPIPSKPAPSKPTPSKPAPSKPAPSKPAPSKPAPSKPAPSKPAPSKPAPSKPAPSKPAPSKPAPSKPAPSKPAPSKPAPSKPDSNLPGIPSSLPGGAKHTETVANPGKWVAHSYNYSKSLGGNAKSSAVYVNSYSDGSAEVSVVGTDEAGKRFMASAMNSSPTRLSYSAYDASQIPQLSGAQENEITNIILAFTKSYGL